MANFRILLCVLAVIAGGCDTPQRWWKGNTHTHTLWSDGDGAPELVADWYVENGYDFLVLSDHNILSVGEKWFPVDDAGRLTEARLEALRERFGDDQVRTRVADGGRVEMRLVTLNDLRARYERRGKFLFIQGEEITDDFEGIPVHVNGLNLATLIEPQGGDSVVDTMQRNVDAVVTHGEVHGRPTLAHVNHPSFGWAITADDLATLRGDPYFEVFNGHPAVNNAGDADHPDTDRMWDLALTTRLAELESGLLYAVAVDDAHHYHVESMDFANAGRGWIVVRAVQLTEGAILDAMHRGDFYASTGVVLKDVRSDGRRYTVHVDRSMAEACTVQFIGTRRVDGEVGPIGAVLLETTANPAVYEFTGDELYVRARVVSSLPPARPWHAGDVQRAWTQPARPR